MGNQLATRKTTAPPTDFREAERVWADAIKGFKELGKVFRVRYLAYTSKWQPARIEGEL